MSVCSGWPQIAAASTTREAMRVTVGFGLALFGLTPMPRAGFLTICDDNAPPPTQACPCTAAARPRASKPRWFLEPSSREDVDVQVADALSHEVIDQVGEAEHTLPNAGRAGQRADGHGVSAPTPLRLHDGLRHRSVHHERADTSIDLGEASASRSQLGKTNEFA